MWSAIKRFLRGKKHPVLIKEIEEFAPQTLPGANSDYRLIPFRCACDGEFCIMSVERRAGHVHYDILDICETMPATFDTWDDDAVLPVDLGLIDMSGFFCPSCRRLGWSLDKKNVCFVRCGACWSLVCGGGTADELTPDGRTIKVFHCHPECGQVGITTPHPSGSMTVESLAPQALDLSEVLHRPPG